LLHPGVHRQAELSLKGRARCLGDGVQRIGALDAEAAIAGYEIFELLRCDRPSAADIGVVLRHVGDALG